jgi:membrane-associated phospholipid phosphatase
MQIQEAVFESPEQIEQLLNPNRGTMKQSFDNDAPNGGRIVDEEGDVTSPEQGSEYHLANGNANGNRSSISEAFRMYIANPYLVSELLACVLCVGLGHIAPEKIFKLSLFMREVPYQITANGDVILDQYINRPLFKKESITNMMVVVIAMVLPFVIILITGLMSKIRNDLHSGICALLFAGGSTLFFTSFLKVYVGYFRPNFFNYSNFDVDSMACGSDSDDARRSFPSAHASYSFCGMTMLTLFFFGKIGLHRGLFPHDDLLQQSMYDEATYFKKRILSIFAGSPMFLATFIATSRIRDDMHHPADVVGGAMIGIACAVFAYGLW